MADKTRLDSDSGVQEEGTSDGSPDPEEKPGVAHSREVIRRKRLTRDLAASLEIHEDEIVTALGEVLEPHLEMGETLELRTLVRVLRRLVEDREDRLNRVAAARRQEKDDDTFRRIELHERTAEVRSLLLDLRRAAAGHYGKDAANAFLGLHGRVGRYPRAVFNQGQTVVKRLADPDWPSPEPTVAHAELGREQWLALLEGPVRELARALEDHAMDRTQTQTAVSKQDLELEKHDHDVHWAARWVIAMYSLVGKEAWTSDLSPRSRHRQRRRRRPDAATTEPDEQKTQA